MFYHILQPLVLAIFLFFVKCFDLYLKLFFLTYCMCELLTFVDQVFKQLAYE